MLHRGFTGFQKRFVSIYLDSFRLLLYPSLWGNFPLFSQSSQKRSWNERVLMIHPQTHSKPMKTNINTLSSFTLLTYGVNYFAWDRWKTLPGQFILLPEQGRASNHRSFPVHSPLESWLPLEFPEFIFFYQVRSFWSSRKIIRRWSFSPGKTS